MKITDLSLKTMISVSKKQAFVFQKTTSWLIKGNLLRCERLPFGK